MAAGSLIALVASTLLAGTPDFMLFGESGGGGGGSPAGVGYQRVSFALLGSSNLSLLDSGRWYRLDSKTEYEFEYLKSLEWDVARDKVSASTGKQTTYVERVTSPLAENLFKALVPVVDGGHFGFKATEGGRAIAIVTPVLENYPVIQALSAQSETFSAKLSEVSAQLTEASSDVAVHRDETRELANQVATLRGWAQGAGAVLATGLLGGIIAFYRLQSQLRSDKAGRRLIIPGE